MNEGQLGKNILRNLEELIFWEPRFTFGAYYQNFFLPLSNVDELVLEGDHFTEKAQNLALERSNEAEDFFRLTTMYIILIEKNDVQ